MSDLKVGDLVLILNGCHRGQMSTVIDGPLYREQWWDTEVDKWVGPFTCFRVEGKNKDADEDWYTPSELLRIPPPDEMRQRERETEKPVTA